MRLFKEVIKNNLKMIIFYVLIGIIINFLDLYSVTYYQKILDAFQFQTLTIVPLITYGVLLLISTILGYIENYPEQQVKNKLYLDFKLQSLKKMKSIDYLEYQKIGTGRLTQKAEDGATASRDIMINFWLKLFRYLLPTAIFSLIFIFRVKKEYVLFVFLGYIIVVIISNLILKKLYKLKESILLNQEFLNKHLVRGFMELVVFRTNKKFDTELKVTKEGIKNIVDGKTKIKLVHEIFFTVFALIVNILKVVVLGYAVLKSDLSVGAVVTVISLLGKAYEPIAIFNVEYVDYKLNKVTVNKYIELLDIKDDELSDNGQFEEFKKKLINEINELNVDGMPKVEKLNALVGKYVNLEYRLPNGQAVKFLNDAKTYLGNQLECEYGGDRCFGVVADMDFILICTYEEDGKNPELVLYKKR